MRLRQPWIPVLLSLPLLLAACADEDSDGLSLYTYGMSTSPYGDEVTLDDGTTARVAVRDEQSIVVQWRTPGEGWGQPQTVYRESDHWIHEDLTLTTAGDTFAINPDYWVEKELADDFPPDHSVQVVCRHLSCTGGQRTTWDPLSITHFTPDGKHAFFQTDDAAAVLWTPESGEREVTLDGVGRHDDITQLDDGSLAAVRVVKLDDECEVQLRATEGATGDFAPAGEAHPAADGPEFGDRTRSCLLYDVDAGSDGVTVYLDEFDEQGVTFRRDGNSWSVED